MSIKVACLECNRVYEIPDSAAGRKGKCECGAVLNVPAKPTPIASKPRPPRTLEEAAAMAEKQREPVYDPAGIAELAKQSRQTRNAEAAELPEPDIFGDGSTPPPLPKVEQAASDGEPPVLTPPPLPAFDSSPPGPRQSPTVVRDYRNLRRCCITLRVVGTVALWLSIISSLLFLFVAIATAADQIATAVTAGNVTWLIRLLGTPLFMAALNLLGGVIISTLLNAIAEFLYVQMDIEENTRR
jgi:hypothetical protein